LEILNGTYTVAVAECDSLTAERDALKVERDALTAERDALKTNVSILVDERDTARYNEYVLQGQVNQLNTDIAAIENERDALKDEVNTLIVERDEARAEAESVRTRIKLVNHQASNDGTKITFSGYAVNTGIETLKGVTFHVTGYDLTSNLVIDLYVLNMTINSGYYTHYSQTIEYAPLVLSAWSVDLLWGDLLPNNE
jgi:regulator of replication initiation timing